MELKQIASHLRRAVSPAPQCYAIHLIDRQTGDPHCVAGTPLVIYSRRPDEAAARLMQNRDPRQWSAFAEIVEGARI